MKKLEKAIYDAFMEQGYSQARSMSVLAAQVATDFIGTAATEGHGDYGYAMWLAESDAE